MNTVYIIRCNDIFSDPRAMKYVKYLDKKKCNFKLIGWDRDGVVTDSSNHKFFKKRAGYNVGGIKAMGNRILWMWFILKTLIKEKKINPILHACDLDAVFPSILYKIFFNKNCIVIFDIFDWLSSTLYNQGRIVLRAFAIMEKIAIKYSDYIIICEQERIEQIPHNVNEEKLYILPNIPYFLNSSFLVENDEFKFDNEKITFSYVGGFEQRCLGEIIELAERGYVNLLIAGFGNIDIENKLKSLNNNGNIKYFGKVEYITGLNIMYNSDIIYAMYSKTNPNHIYAAPNKLYESMFLGKPIFSTKGIIVEKKIDKMNIGYTSEESTNDVLSVIKNINIKECIEKGNNAKQIWNDTYCNYVNNFFENVYSKIINRA
jgi:hypothetical protein